MSIDIKPFYDISLVSFNIINQSKDKINLFADRISQYYTEEHIDDSYKSYINDDLTESISIGVCNVIRYNYKDKVINTYDPIRFDCNIGENMIRRSFIANHRCNRLTNIKTDIPEDFSVSLYNFCKKTYSNYNIIYKIGIKSYTKKITIDSDIEVKLNNIFKIHINFILNKINNFYNLNQLVDSKYTSENMFINSTIVGYFITETNEIIIIITKNVKNSKIIIIIRYTITGSYEDEHRLSVVPVVDKVLIANFNYYSCTYGLFYYNNLFYIHKMLPLSNQTISILNWNVELKDYDDKHKNKNSNTLIRTGRFTSDTKIGCRKMYIYIIGFVDINIDDKLKFISEINKLNTFYNECKLLYVNGQYLKFIEMEHDPSNDIYFDIYILLFCKLYKISIDKFKVNESYIKFKNDMVLNLIKIMNLYGGPLVTDDITDYSWTDVKTYFYLFTNEAVKNITNVESARDDNYMEYKSSTVTIAKLNTTLQSFDKVHNDHKQLLVSCVEKFLFEHINLSPLLVREKFKIY